MEDFFIFYITKYKNRKGIKYGKINGKDSRFMQKQGLCVSRIGNLWGLG
jgi:hypothetical protein